MILDIVKLDRETLWVNPRFSKSILREVCTDIQEFNRDLYDLTQNMVETMFAANGVGLAAPQVGIGMNLFVMRTENGLKNNSKEAEIIINPNLTLAGETYKDIEGCLSIPGLLGRVERYKEIAYTSVDAEGKPRAGSLSELSARIFQHEYDHLSGVLFVDKSDKFYRPR